VRQAVKRRVVRFEDRLGTYETWGMQRFECGHSQSVGPTYTPKRMACWECEQAAPKQDGEDTGASDKPSPRDGGKLGMEKVV